MHLYPPKYSTKPGLGVAAAKQWPRDRDLMPAKAPSGCSNIKLHADIIWMQIVL